MSTSQETPKIPLPKGWKQHVRLAVLHVISLAQYATVYTRSWAADNTWTPWMRVSKSSTKGTLDRTAWSRYARPAMFDDLAPDAG